MSFLILKAFQIYFDVVELVLKFGRAAIYRLHLQQLHRCLKFFLLFVYFISLPLAAATDDTTKNGTTENTGGLFSDSDMRLKAAELNKAILAKIGSVNQPTNEPFNTNLKSCLAAINQASTLCAETNPKTQSALAIINGVIAAGSGMSATDACKNNSKILDLATAAVGAFNLMCGGAKAFCDIRCGDLVKSSSNLNCTSPPAKPSCPDVLPEVVANAKAMSNLCNEYGMMLTTGVATLGRFVLMGNQSKQCEKGLSTCEKNPLDPSCSRLNCSDNKNVATAQCICEKAPQTPGCPQADRYQPLTVGSNSNGLQMAGSRIDSSSNLGSLSDGFGSGDAGSAIGGNGGGSASSMGGGKSGLLGSVDGSNKSGSGNSGSVPKGKGFNTNILSADGGGGGGGKWGGGNSSSDLNGAYAKYGRFMPGAANGGRNVATDKKMLNPEVSQGGGKTNWEKVRESYQDQSPSMFGN